MTDHLFDEAMDDLAAGDPYSADAPYVPLSGMGVTRAQYALQAHRGVDRPHSVARSGDARDNAHAGGNAPSTPPVFLPAVSRPETLNPASGMTRGS